MTAGIAGFRCAVCATAVDITTPWPWRCPRATPTDRRHVLRLAGERRLAGRGRRGLVEGTAWAAFAAAHGMTVRAMEALAASYAAALGGVDGGLLADTPFARSPGLSAALGFVPEGGVWVKDETGAVAGSHKARHLHSIMLHLLAAEALGLAPVRERPPLAIASCGNAALAAATVAAATAWPLEVFVPPSADAGVLRRLRALGATVTLCPRHDGGAPGDPCVHRFHAAVDAGAIPFAVQGPENALCLDLGRSLGWELAGHAIDAVFVQVGGGALATAVADGCADAGERPRLLAVQTAGCAPLARAWAEHAEAGGPPGATWAACMRAWETEPRSLAYGILDDETYDWVGVAEGVAASNGAMVVVDEAEIEAANRLGRDATGIDVDHTGTAGLAGLLHVARGAPWPEPQERVAVLFTGRRRSA